MARKLTPSNEDYLEAIFALSEEGKPVRSTDVASRLGVSRASVNKAVGLLREGDFILQQPYGTIQLTEKGAMRACKVQRCHTFLRSFFEEILGVDPERADAEACLIEHALSEDTLARWMRFVDSLEKS